MISATLVDMEQCALDPSVARREVEGFRFPLGVYPIEPMQPRSGYSVVFEPADGGTDESDYEEWPDRYLFDAVISADRLESLCTMLFSLLPGRLYPILDVLGMDAYREIDPYIAYNLVPVERFADNVRRFRPFLYEDGLVGFGAFSENPFYYVFIDEHKVVTVRAETSLKERVERLLAAYDLMEIDEPAGAESAAHEHRSVLLVAPDRPELLAPHEIIERLKDEWRLLLNIDPETNLDEEGKPLGITLWRCLVRCEKSKSPARYALLTLRASCLREAEEIVHEAIERMSGDEEGWDEVVVVTSSRIKTEHLDDTKELGGKPVLQGRRGESIIEGRWLD
jgi:hypothetical protein